jgi:uncharacterized protein (TIGR00369 family)
MYRSAPIQKKYPGIALTIAKGSAEISVPIDESYHHAGGSLHGSVFFRLLDDVCYFAAMSEEKEFFYVTKTFSIQFFKPMQHGLLIAKSEEIVYKDREFIASASIYNENGKKLASGSGVFTKIPVKLDPSIGYKMD